MCHAQTGVLRLEPTGSGLLSRPPPPPLFASIAQPLANLSAPFARFSATTRGAFERAMHLGSRPSPQLLPVAEQPRGRT